MRLVACTACHAQYDVTDVAEKFIDCRCGEQVENRLLRGVDAEIHRCGSCGAGVAQDVPSCGYCGSEIVRDRSRREKVGSGDCRGGSTRGLQKAAAILLLVGHDFQTRSGTVR